MSGEAGAGASSTYFRIFYSSGMTVSIAMPPNPEEDPHYIANYFKEADKPFEQKLEEVLPKLEGVMLHLIQELNFPIAVFDPDADHFPGIIIEDTDEFKPNPIEESEASNRFQNTNSCVGWISFNFMTPLFTKITLSLTVNKQIRRSQLNVIKAHFREHFC